MSPLFRSCASAALLLVCSAVAVSQDKEMADNPMYKFWSKSPVGASVSLKETTKLTAPEGMGDTGEEVRLITHKLIELTPEKAVVQTVVTEGEVFGFVESAPTRHIYPAKMSKDVLEELIKETGAKGEKAKLKVGDKEMDVLYLTGMMTRGQDDVVSYKLWLSDTVPGSIVKRVRVNKLKGGAVAETTVEVVKFSK